MSDMQDFLFDRDVRRVFAALGNPRVEVSAQSIKTVNGQPVLLADGTPETITRVIDYDRDVETILHPEFVKEMRKLNLRDNNIYMKPTETADTIYILVDDTKPLLYDRFTPNIHFQTSLPHKRQAVYAVPFLYDREDGRREARRLYMDVFAYLNLAHGDANIRGLRHAFRIPGLSNRKPVYAPHFPFVKLLSAKKGTDPRIIAWIDDCASGKFPLLREIARMKREIAGGQPITVDPNPLHDDAMPEDMGPGRAPSGGRMRSAGETDHRGADMEKGWEMARAGATTAEIEAELLINSAHLANPCGYDLDSSRYVSRTAERTVAAVEKSRGQHILPTIRKPSQPGGCGPIAARIRRAAALAAASSVPKP